MHMGQGWLRNVYMALTYLMITLLIGGCSPLSHSLEPNPTQSQQTGILARTKGIIPDGTKVDDLDLSGVHVNEVQAKMSEWAKDKLEETRILVYNETEVPITLKDLGFDVDANKTLEEIQKKPGTTRSSVLKVDTLKASQVLQEKLKKFARPAQDAIYKIENDKFVIKPAVSGRTVAADRLLGDIQKSSLSDLPERLGIPMVDVPASVSTESLQALAFDTVIGEFTTRFSVKEENRSANLTAAAKAIDRKVLQPGEIFSFNETVGPRKPETGYKDAYVIINGEYVQGTGGGVCQVSSTLYNAVLLANIGIAERMPHAVAVSYVPTGQDATVNYPNIDFKFKNDTANVLYIRSEVKSGSLTLRIWGKKSNQSVRLERQVEKEMPFQIEKRPDPTLPAGRVIQDQTGSKGFVVNTWRVVRDAKGNETKQFLGRDTYAPANRILRIGSRGVS